MKWLLEVIAIIIRPFTYNSEVQIISGRKNSISIENLTPILTGEELAKQRRCIETSLYDIFSKYT